MIKTNFKKNAEMLKLVMDKQSYKAVANYLKTQYNLTFEGDYIYFQIGEHKLLMSDSILDSDSGNLYEAYMDLGGDCEIYDHTHQKIDPATAMDYIHNHVGQLDNLKKDVFEKYNYYMKELMRLNPIHTLRFQFHDDDTSTKFLDLNSESIEALENYLKLYKLLLRK